MLGNGVVGILSESSNIWERRSPLTPSHCARLLHGGTGKTEVKRIIVQPSTKRIYHEALYEDVGCEISDDLSECGLILGVKQPKLDMILPDRAYAFFSHTHKAQKENMPLLDKILAERASLYDYELIIGNHGKRLLAFGKYAGIAGLIDFLSGLGKRYLNLGYSTPFLSLGASYMYSSLAAAKAAVIAVGEEIATLGLPSGICPLVFVFTGSGNVSQGAQEIFKLLPHTFVDPSRLPELYEMAKDHTQRMRTSRRGFRVYGCVVTCQDIVEPKDPSKPFDKADYYSHPEHYSPIFHERIAPYASVIVNCMYWEKRFPRLLSTKQLQEQMRKQCRLIGVSDITCDIGGSIEFVSQTTSMERPFFRYNPLSDSYHHDMEGEGLICLAVDNLPTEFAKEASQHFGDILSQFIGSLASVQNISDLPPHLRKACIAHGGILTPLYEYIPRMRNSSDSSANISGDQFKKKYNILVSLSGHLFDQFLINEALDIIEAAGGSFHLARCEVGQSADAMSYSELEVGADDSSILDQIIDSLSAIAYPKEASAVPNKETNRFSLRLGKVPDNGAGKVDALKKRNPILILGAGRVCQPAAELLASTGSISSHQWFKTCLGDDIEQPKDVQVIVASLYLKDAEETIEGIPNATAIQLDVMDHESLCKCVSQVEVVISLLPASFHAIIANACIEFKKHLVTASYIDDSTSRLDERAKSAGITILGEMGLDPGIDHMMAMKMIDRAHARNGIIKSFVSYCGGLPSPEAANNPLAYKFSWNPAGAIRAGRNPATYKSDGKIVHVDGNKLYDSATRIRIADLPAFALECLPNRNSLIYGDLYGIMNEASTIFRGTLRYEGFCEIMGTLAKIGFFDTEAHPALKQEKQPTFESFLDVLLRTERENENLQGIMGDEKEMVEILIAHGLCKEKASAVNTVKTIKFLGLHDRKEIPLSCRSAFDVICLRMEERLTYSNTEQDMVLLHHEVEVSFPDGRPTENQQSTLLEFGKMKNGKTTTAMALTVGIPAAIAALLLLENRIKTRGVIRPLNPEVYMPALDILEAYGFKLLEKIE
ncbi:alpha-aminoadipic semialdehyde synthase [Macadamia integrifolia]|uniref:alpha-aminoadipic semialdehyde synthase n=1 Tax=Macadamia integrifolia TaxID=60698 RepID=UPI001C50193E|nr:alpha-aminoadipic semialdehyde synthase [Macadamia integrifolia]XP_042486510.1 alpha-aminoadipic semialdehyde synthase [Macadamia integrifolia]